MKPNHLIVIVLALVALSVGCGSQTGSTGQAKPSKTPPAEMQPHLKKLEEAEAKGKKMEAEFRAMSVPDLVKRLEEDSVKSVEPFNSVAFRQVRTRGAGAGRELAGFVKKADRSSFLTLMGVYATSKEDYNRIDVALRAAILTDALRGSKHFNTWGLPHLYWEDAAKALIETGQAAEPALREMLKDSRDAPVWGSEEVHEYQRYKYRVKDYAWALLMEIRGTRTEIPPEPEARDRLIAQFGQ